MGKTKQSGMEAQQAAHERIVLSAERMAENAANRLQAAVILKGKRFDGTVDLTPSREALCPRFFHCITQGTPEQPAYAKREIVRMAKALDA